MKKTIALMSLLALASLSIAASAESNVVKEKENLCVEGSQHCTFVLLSEKVSEQNSTSKPVISIINDQRARIQFSPFSTFKVANSLIALDSGIVSNSQQPLTFNKDTYPVQAWWPPVWKLPNYNLTTAFKYSMVAIYRQMATDIGQSQMKEYVAKFSYGNENISSGLDDFWLDGSLQISAVEQISFLQKIYHNQFKVNVNSIKTLKEVMLVESTDDYKLYAKTGAGWLKEPYSDNKNTASDKPKKVMLGWYVGFVENAQGVHYFAFNFTRDSYAQMKANRVNMAMNHLKKVGII